MSGMLRPIPMPRWAWAGVNAAIATRTAAPMRTSRRARTPARRDKVTGNIIFEADIMKY
jgi:hypothetical protein